MAGNQYFLLLLVLIAVEECNSRGFSSFSRPWVKTKQKHPSLSTMRKDMFKELRNTTSTVDFLKSANKYDEAKKKHFLPSQMKPPPMLKLRSAGSSAAFQSMLNLDFQNCTVRPTIHFLEQPPLSENAFIWPHAVQLPLCGGSCGIRNDILACRGNTKVPIKMPAYKVFYHSSRRRRDVMEEFAKLEDPIQKLTKRSMDNIQIIDVKLEAHADCACGCTATKEMCRLEKKVLNPDICQCECEQQKDCTIPFQWDEDNCECKCAGDRVTKIHTCLRDSKHTKTWDHKICGCVCRNNPVSCPPMNTFDDNTCLCTCNANATCPLNQTLENGVGRYMLKACYCK